MRYIKKLRWIKSVLDGNPIKKTEKGFVFYYNKWI